MAWIFLSIALQLGALSLLKLIGTSGAPGVGHTLLHPLFIAAFVLLAAQSLAWQLALKRYPLGYAYTVQALIYPAGLAIGVLAFQDVVTGAKLAGVALIVTGVALSARAA